MVFALSIEQKAYFVHLNKSVIVYLCGYKADIPYRLFLLYKIEYKIYKTEIIIQFANNAKLKEWILKNNEEFTLQPS